jgi:hypothetical protein
MDTEHLPGQILLMLICIVLATGLWYLWQRTGKLMFKQLAIMIVVAPIIGLGLGPAWSWFGFDRLDIRGTANGPAPREAFTKYEGPIPVGNLGATHQLTLTPSIWGASPPSKPLHLRFEVRSPTGEVLAQGEQDLAPAKGFRWSALRAEFRPREQGQHLLLLDIPSPAGHVDFWVKELGKSSSNRLQ